MSVSAENADVPTILVALTLAIICYPQAIANGEAIRAEIGTVHFVSLTTVADEPSQVAVYGKKVPP